MKPTMLVTVSLILGVSWVASELNPVQPLMAVNPKYSFEEWQDIFQNQNILPEVCVGCKKGRAPQPGLAGRVASGHNSRIIGGSLASEGQFPWLVQLLMDDSYFCGGSILNQEWILTAAHCVFGYSTFVVSLGSLYTQSDDPNKVTQTSRNGILHDQYNDTETSNDIALIKLPSKILSWNANVRPIRLPALSESTLSFANEPAVLSGWGVYGTDSVSDAISDELRYVNLVVITNTECSQIFGSGIRSTNICTSGESPQGTPVGSCGGDSGGALVLNRNGIYSQIGIVSFGVKDGCTGKFPSAMTRVTSYLKWISSTTGIAIRP